MKYSKIPFVRKLYNKIKAQDSKIDLLEHEIMQVAKENLNLRLRVKKFNNEKIKVVFICNRPTVWSSLNTVYESMKNDNDFDIKMVIVPSKKQIGTDAAGYNHNVFESEGVEEYFKNYKPIVGYDVDKKEWINLQRLNPDYVFLQQPYNIKLPDELKSWNISKYAKLCYVAYYAFFQNNETNFINDDCTPIDYLKNLSFYFAQNDEDYYFITNKLKINGINTVDVIKSGFPRYDNENINKRSDSDLITWKSGCKPAFKVLWTPRWCTNENNCHFFDYKDKILNFFENNVEYDLMFRPHPQAFINWIATGMMSEAEIRNLKKRFEISLNMTLDEEFEYLPNFYASDCLITDTSSIVDDYFLTGKPIIYCHKENSLNSFAKNKGYTKGFYWVENWNELESTIKMLKNGNDPLKKVRQELIQKCYYRPDGGSGVFIKNCIKEDFYK